MSNVNRGEEAVDKYRAADKKNLDDILDLINPADSKGTAKELKARADESGKAFDNVKADLGIGSRPKGPGVFSRIGKAFRSFGKGVANLFGRKSATPALDPGATLDLATTPAARERSETMSEDDIKNNLNVTYTRAQGREAAQKLNEPDRSSTGAPAAMSDDVKKSLNVTMTPAEAKEAARQLAHQHELERANANEKSDSFGLGS